jgi:hypothetical protein
MGFQPFSAVTSKIFGAATLALLMVAALQSCKIDRVEGERDDARQLAQDTQAAFDTTVADYRAKAAEAGRVQAETLVRVAAERDAVAERKIHDLQVARDSADARYRRLLASAAEADSRGAGDPDLSAFADATCRAYAGTGCHELPALLKAAQDNTDQLIALQGWARDQAAIATAPIGDQQFEPRPRPRHAQ